MTDTNTCHYCLKTGHWARDCRIKRQDEYQVTGESQTQPYTPVQHRASFSPQVNTNFQPQQQVTSSNHQQHQVSSENRPVHLLWNK